MKVGFFFNLKKLILFHYSLAPPNVEAVDASIIGLRRKNVTLSFTILNAAPLVIRENISWNFTNTTQHQWNDSRYVFSEDGLSLTILNLMFEDEGEYEITTTNRNGMDTAVIALTVDGKLFLIAGLFQL